MWDFWLSQKLYTLLFMNRRILYSIFGILFALMVGCSQESQTACYTVAQPLTKQQLMQRKHETEIFKYFAENVYAYQNIDGTQSIYIYSAPVEKSANAITLPTTSSLQALTSSETDFFIQGTYFSKQFPKIWSIKSGLNLPASGSSLRIFPETSGAYSGELKQQRNIFGQFKEAVCYEDTFGNNIPLYAYPTSFGVNTEIVLPKYEGINTFRVKIQTPTLVPDTGSPDYILFKTALEKGVVNSILYTPMAVDKKGKWSYNNTVTLVDKDTVTNTYTVEYTIDQAFLENAEVTYPVTLNQSFHQYKPKQPDTSAYSKTGDEASHYLSPYMLLGDSTLKGEGWTYVRYETLNNLNIPADKIISATYTVHNLFDLPDKAVLGAYAVTADWCSINTRWFNRPPFDETPINQVVIQKRGDYTLDITSLMKEMIRNKPFKNAKYSVQNSFMIRCDTDGRNIALASGDNGLFSPVLQIVVME